MTENKQNNNDRTDRRPDCVTEIWNTIIEEGNTFPQTDLLTPEQAEEFFAQQSFTAVAEEDGEAVGLYILHPNNVGRCGHIANAGYMIRPSARGKHIGELLVKLEETLEEQGKEDRKSVV